MEPKETRWRKVQVIDEGWALEMKDSTYKAADQHASFEAPNEDGWRPVGCVWFAKGSEEKPWRGDVYADPADKSFRDYTTLERAKNWVERWWRSL